MLGRSGIQFETLAKRTVALQLFNDEIQKRLSQLPVGFEECDKILAGVWMRPHAVLHANETECGEKLAKLVTHIPPLLSYVENEESPSLVPRRLHGNLVAMTLYLSEECPPS